VLLVVHAINGETICAIPLYGMVEAVHCTGAVVTVVLKPARGGSDGVNKGSLLVFDFAEGLRWEGMNRALAAAGKASKK
jgi:hypothetical protein